MGLCEKIIPTKNELSNPQRIMPSRYTIRYSSAILTRVLYIKEDLFWIYIQRKIKKN